MLVSSMLFHPNQKGLFSTKFWHRLVGHWQYPSTPLTAWKLFKHRFAFSITTGQSELKAIISTLRYPRF